MAPAAATEKPAFVNTNGKVTPRNRLLDSERQHGKETIGAGDSFQIDLRLAVSELLSCICRAALAIKPRHVT